MVLLDAYHDAAQSVVWAQTSELDNAKAVANRRRASLDAELARLVADAERLKRELAEALTPDLYGDWDGRTAADLDDIDTLADDLRCGGVKEVWANHVLGSRWLARVPVTFDDDGTPEEIETRMFDTESEARVAAARAVEGATP
jgi:hypothetical protein